MNRTFFDFCHLVYAADKSLVTLEPDIAYSICIKAFDECNKLDTDHASWVNAHYKSWLMRGGLTYISDRFPDKIKNILTDENT